MSTVDQAFNFIVQAEGATLDLNPNDRGNWTGGAIGVGELRGSKFGVSAAAYPDEDIAALTRERAVELFRRGYWDKVRGDDLPPGLALLAADAAYNGGHPIYWLQLAAGASPDGVLGPATLAAISAAAARRGVAALLAEFAAEHLAYLTALPTWTLFGADRGNPKGWDRRLFQMILNAQLMGA